MDKLSEDLLNAIQTGSEDKESQNLDEVIRKQQQILTIKENINSLSKEEIKSEREKIRIAQEAINSAIKAAEQNRSLFEGDNYDKYTTQLKGLSNQLGDLDTQLASRQGDTNFFKSINKGIDSVNENVFGLSDNIRSFSRTLERSDTFTGGVIELNEQFLSLKTNLGLNNVQLDSFSKNIKQSAVNAGILGFNIGDIINLQKELSEETGTYNILSREDIERVAVLRRALPELQGELPELVAAFDRIGYGPVEAVEAFEEVLTESNKAGVNANKVAKSVSKTLQNASILARFRGGISDITKMAVQAEKFKLSMDAVFAAADKGRDLEGSIDAVSQLNLLGGKFAEIDPFSFLDMSRNDPEALQRTIANMVSDLGTLQEDGTIGFSSVDIDRIKAAADALGIGFEDLRKSAERTAKLNVIESLLPSNLTEEQKDLIANFAQVRKGGRATVEIDGMGTVDVSQINDEQLAILQKMQEEQAKTDLDRQAEAAISSAEYLRNINDTLLRGIPINLAEGALRTETALDINSGVRDVITKNLSDFVAGAYGPGSPGEKANQVLDFIQNKSEEFFTGIATKLSLNSTGANTELTTMIDQTQKSLQIQAEAAQSAQAASNNILQGLKNLFASPIKADLSEANVIVKNDITLQLDGKAIQKIVIDNAEAVVDSLNKASAGQ